MGSGWSWVTFWLGHCWYTTPLITSYMVLVLFHEWAVSMVFFWFGSSHTYRIPQRKSMYMPLHDSACILLMLIVSCFLYEKGGLAEVEVFHGIHFRIHSSVPQRLWILMDPIWSYAFRICSGAMRAKMFDSLLGSFRLPKCVCVCVADGSHRLSDWTYKCLLYIVIGLSLKYESQLAG